MKPTIGRLWALRGVTPKIMVKPGYKNFYVYSAVDPSKGEHFSLILPWVNTDMMNLFLQQLSDAYPGHPILLIVDQAGWHKAKDLFSHSHIKIRYLPAYSPELNPVERLWKWLRKHVCRNRLFSSLEELADTLESSINSFSANFLKQLCHCSYM
jgi:putative transposase